ncbi:MAG: hypothetical protein FRX49_10896 [Trebouxia sp. A1-2]|nr:MAG: hypothetical protein FRX49_10896 [Trebouxia sp. A1-2]
MPSALPLVHAAPPPSPPSLPSPSSPTPAPPSIFTPANHLVPRPSPPPTLFQGFPLKPTPSAPSPQPPAPLSTSRLFSTAVHSPCWLSRLAPASSPSAPVDLYADCKYTASGVAVSDPLTPTRLSLAVLPVPYGLGISNWGSILSASSVNTSVAVFTGASATSVPKAPHLPQSADLSVLAGAASSAPLLPPASPLLTALSPSPTTLLPSPMSSAPSAPLTLVTSPPPPPPTHCFPTSSPPSSPFAPPTPPPFTPLFPAPSTPQVVAPHPITAHAAPAANSSVFAGYFGVYDLACKVLKQQVASSADSSNAPAPGLSKNSHNATDPTAVDLQDALTVRYARIKRSADSEAARSLRSTNNATDAAAVDLQDALTTQKQPEASEAPTMPLTQPLWTSRMP